MKSIVRGFLLLFFLFTTFFVVDYMVLLQSTTIDNEPKVKKHVKVVSSFNVSPITLVLERISSFQQPAVVCHELPVTSMQDYVCNTCRVSNASEPGFLTGPGVESITRNDSVAVCQFVYEMYARHFAHGMAQLYRCLAWWLENSDRRPILIYDAAANNERPSAFYRGYFTALQDVFGVTIVSNHSSPAVYKDRGIYVLPGSQFCDAMTNQILQYYNLSHHVKTSLVERKKNYIPRVSLLNRQKTRRMRNADDLRDRLLHLSNESNSRFTVSPVLYFESASFLEQVQAFASTDILISIHGAQLTGIPFMPRCSSLLEIFPFQYRLPAYYGGLASAANISYHFVTFVNHTPEFDIISGRKNQSQAIIVRSQNFCLPVENISSLILQLVDEWKSCVRKQKFE